MAEVDEQTQAVESRQTAAAVAPLFQEIGGVGRRRQGWLQEFRSVVIEAKITRRELLFKDSHAREKGHRATLDLGGRPDQNLAFTLKKCARDPAADVLGKR